MRNIMVCVTQQKNCDRLIEKGSQFLENEEDELFIIHIAYTDFKFLGNDKESEALDYLYEKALEYGANLTVVRSDDTVQTLIEIANKNQISHIVMGGSHESTKETNVVDNLHKKIDGEVTIIVVP